MDQVIIFLQIIGLTPTVTLYYHNDNYSYHYYQQRYTCEYYPGNL